MIVDDMHHNHPELLKDVYWNQTVPSALPYTEETAHYRKDEPRGSAEKKGTEEDIYYSKSQTIYPLFKNKLGGSSKQALDVLEPYSDYEAIDSNLIGWWKNKIRKSQMRKSGRSMSSTASAGYKPEPPRRRRMSKSGAGIYAKLVASVSTRKASISSMSSVDGKRLVMAEDSIRSTVDIDSDLYRIYGDPGITSTSSTSTVASAASDQHLDSSLVVERLRRMTNLSTITENINSPYSTHMGSRRNSNHPSTDGLFEMPDGGGGQTSHIIAEEPDDVREPALDHIKGYLYEDQLKLFIDKNVYFLRNPQVQSTASGNSSESPYYPMGSETSARPFTPRFTIEEVSSNYETVLVTNRPEIIVITPDTGPSPMLPKRQARMELTAINIKRPSAAFTENDRGLDNEACVVLDEDDEVFEEIDAPKNESAAQNANSAFDNAAFFV
jgi:hypothetical protein